MAVDESLFLVSQHIDQLSQPQLGTNERTTSSGLHIIVHPRFASPTHWQFALYDFRHPRAGDMSDGNSLRAARTLVETRTFGPVI